MIYYDAFIDEYVKGKIEFAPPERYCEIICSPNDSYKETWFVGNGEFLDITYTEQEIKDVVVHKKRLKLAEENLCTLRYIAKWEIPKKAYKEVESNL